MQQCNANMCSTLLFMGTDSESLESLEFHGLHCNVCAQPPSSDSEPLECAVSKPPDFPTEAKYQWYFIQISHNYISYKYHTNNIQISYEYPAITHCIHTNADIAPHGYSKRQSISAGLGGSKKHQNLNLHDATKNCVCTGPWNPTTPWVGSHTTPMNLVPQNRFLRVVFGTFLLTGKSDWTLVFFCWLSASLALVLIGHSIGLQQFWFLTP